MVPYHFISSKFPHTFYFQGQRNQVDKEVGYHSPLVAIQVDESTSFFLVSFLILFRLFVSIPSPSLDQVVQVDPATKGQLVHMECRAYYRGVKHDKKDKLGLVQFEVQVL